MTTAAQAFANLRRLKPEGALAYLQGRGLITKTWSWADLLADEHTYQFTISRLASVDLLMELQQLITDSVNGDLSRKDFLADARSALARKGWWGESTTIDPATGDEVTTRFNMSRLRLILDTNVRQAAVAGQWERIEETKRAFPYLRYVALDDARAAHGAWRNLVLPVDDPFWSTHTPQNGYGCRCYVRQVSQRDYDKGTTPTGQKMDKTAPPERLSDWTNPRTGEVLQVPAGVHPAFVGNAGKDRQTMLQKVTNDKLSQAPKNMADKARELIQKGGNPGKLD